MKYNRLLAGYLLAILIYVLFVVGYERHAIDQAREESAEHAEHLSGHLWDISMPGAEQYVQLVLRAGDYRSINVFHEDGEPFVLNVSGLGEADTEPHPLENFLFSLGLIRDVQFQEEITAQGHLIGSVESVWINRGVFVYLYAFLVLVLSLAVLTMADYSRRAKAERRAVQRALSESRQRLETIVAGAPVILFGLDPDGRFTACEGKGLDQLGEKAQNAVGLSLEDVFGDDPQVREDFERALNGESLSAVRSADDRTLEISYTPLHTQDQLTGVTGVATDITDLHRALNDLRQRDERTNLELDLARTIQQALVPTTVPALEGCEFGMLYVPSFGISGDLISFIDSEQDHLLRVVFADISGHGVAAALLSTMFKVLTDEVLGRKAQIEDHDFHQLARRLNKHFPIGYFASAFYAELDSRNRMLRYVKASQEPALVFRPGQPVLTITEGGPALGLLPLDMINDDTYPVRSLQLEPGDTVFFYTDGLIELWNPDHVALERSDLVDWIEEDLHLSPQALIDRIYARARDFAQVSQLEDDVAVFVIRVT